MYVVAQQHVYKTMKYSLSSPFPSQSNKIEHLSFPKTNSMDAVLSQNFNYSVEGLENIVLDTVCKHTYAYSLQNCAASFMLSVEGGEQPN